MTPIIGNITTLRSVDFGDAGSPGGAKTWSQVSNTSSEQTVTVPGLRLGLDLVFGVTKPTQQNGLGVCSARISADDTLAITFVCAGTVTPTAGEKYSCLVARLENNNNYSAVA